MAHPLDGPKHYLLISTADICHPVNELTLLDMFSDWDSWMSFMRLLGTNEPATMTAHYDDEATDDFRVIRSADHRMTSTFNNPFGLDEQNESRG